MTERPWTPGPWHSTATFQIGADGITYAVADVGGGSTSERKANATLIAAAPELLEALAAFVENFTDTSGGCDGCDSIGGKHQDWCLIPPSIAAIAKATGGAS